MFCPPTESSTGSFASCEKEEKGRKAMSRAQRFFNEAFMGVKELLRLGKLRKLILKLGKIISNNWELLS
jgi:hypothetical protein